MVSSRNPAASSSIRWFKIATANGRPDILGGNDIQFKICRLKRNGGTFCNQRFGMSLDHYRRRFQKQGSAEKYARRFDKGSRARISARELRAVESLLDELPDCGTIVDIPCGAGRLIPALAAKGRKVQGFDIAAPMLEIARLRHGESATFAEADVRHIPLTDGSVDCVFCNRLLHHLTDAGERQSVLRELCRVTRRWAVVSFFDYGRWKGLRLFTRIFKDANTCKEKAPTLAEFTEELRQAGFGIERCVRAGGWWASQSYFVLHRNNFAAARN